MTVTIKAKSRKPLVVEYDGAEYTLPGRIPAEIMTIQARFARPKNPSKEAQEQFQRDIGVAVVDKFYELVVPSDFKGALDMEDLGPVFEAWSEHVGLGESKGFRELAESYPDELVWELHKLGIDVENIGGDDPEAVDHVKVDRLLRVATREPSSVLYAATHGWEYPVSREWIIAADTIDAFYQANSGHRKPKPYPRPWKNNNTSRLGKTTLSPSEAREVLRKNRG